LNIFWSEQRWCRINISHFLNRPFRNLVRSAGRLQRLADCDCNMGVYA
jgi:hypothetical protein